MPPFLRSRATRAASPLPLAAALLALALATPVFAVRGQTVDGSIRVSLTIVQGVSSVAPRFSTPRRDGAGAMLIAGSAPSAGPTSQIVMVALLDDARAPLPPAAHLSVHSATGDLALVPGVAVPSTATGLVSGAAGTDAFPIGYRFRPGTRSRGGDPVTLHLAYLTVPGT